MKRLGYCQSICLDLYKDCKRRTKKDIDFRDSKDDEKLIRFMLENTSITEHEGERSFYNTDKAIHNICHQLCPGKWCDRYHCKHNSSHCAYSCTHTRPAVCKEYKKYIEKKQEREAKKGGLE